MPERREVPPDEDVDERLPDERAAAHARRQAGEEVGKALPDALLPGAAAGAVVDNAVHQLKSEK